MEKIITLDYGSGGRKTSSLIEEMIVPAFDNEALSVLGDGAVLEGSSELVFSTDSFVVSPYFFPGGDIGKLSVCGTVNDIAMAGGIPKYLSASFIIEEGLPMEDLERIIRSAADTARSLGVSIVTGDTKVVEKGKGDGIYINTSGIGFLKKPGLSPDNIRPGDVVILSGTAGDHGAAVMLARNELGIAENLHSDCAPLCEMASGLYELGDELRILRDPTRGGVATTLCEFADGRAFSIELSESSIHVKTVVFGVCDMLGLDPLYCANEGKLIAVVSMNAANKALDIIKSYPQGADAAIIGRVCSENAGYVTLRTASGGSRILTKLTGAQLPRIC